MVEASLFENEDGLSIPSSPNQLLVRECDLRQVKHFVEENHYSHSIFGCTASRCFGVTFEHDLVGAAIFGLPAGSGVKEKYSSGENLLELRRFVLADRCPRNSESYVLGAMFRILRKSGVDVILSYADPAYGHEGVIYRALGFEYKGLTAKRKHFIWNGIKYPDRNLHQTNFPFHARLREAVENGTASAITIPGKHIFLKRIALRRAK